MSGPGALVVPAVKRHTATVIMAHGLGDTGAGWVTLAENWRRRQKFEEVKFIFPNAPTIPITVVSPTAGFLEAITLLKYLQNMGMRMPGWYDIKQFGNLNSEQDETGILRSRDYFHGLIKQEIEGGIPSNRIVIGGFSQGGAISLITGITCPTPLGGIFGLSCYLLLHNKIKDLVPAGNPNKDTPIFMGHGAIDPLVLPKWGELTANILKEWGWKVNLKMYPYVFCL
jgi:predicted esterase